MAESPGFLGCIKTRELKILAEKRQFLRIAKKLCATFVALFAFAIAPAYADEPTNTCPEGQILHQYESATGTVSQAGTPSPTNPIEPVFYTQGDMVLRRIGDYADSYDATTGKITRRIGVKVLNGSEAWSQFPNSGRFYLSNSFLDIDGSVRTDASCSHFPATADAVTGVLGFMFFKNFDSEPMQLRMTYPSVTSVSAFKTWLAEQYAAGTPVTVYYPLATPVEENWPSTRCAPTIKIATTAYNDAQFAPVEQALESAVTTIKDVVANTIVQADAIQNLQDTKQTMPDASGTNGTCPRFRQCLLIETDDGTPQWYPIIDPFRDFVTPILANNDHITPVNEQRRYYGDQQFCTALSGTDLAKCTNDTPGIDKETVAYNSVHGALHENEWGYEFKANNIGANPATDNPNNDEGIVYGISKCVSSTVQTNSVGFATKLDNVPSPYQSTIRGELERTYDYNNPTYSLGKYTKCWCKMTSIAYGGKYYETSAAPWVFFTSHGSSASCASDCANVCAREVRGDTNVRQSVMGWAVE